MRKVRKGKSFFFIIYLKQIANYAYYLVRNIQLVVLKIKTKKKFKKYKKNETKNPKS